MIIELYKHIEKSIAEKVKALSKAFIWDLFLECM